MYSIPTADMPVARVQISSLAMDEHHLQEFSDSVGHELMAGATIVSSGFDGITRSFWALLINYTPAGD